MAGCEPKRITVIKPPADKLQCAAEPAVPDEPVTDAKVAGYIVEQRAAWGDCSQKLHWLKDWFAAMPD